MKAFAKKLTAAILAAVSSLGTVIPAFASADKTTGQAVRFNDDGNLRIMHITDTHLSMDNLNDSVALIALACDREQPDIVMITGDIAMADTKEETFLKTGRLMSVFEERHIPVAVTFGNHDSEYGSVTREELMAYYGGYTCSVAADDGELLPGCGTYNVPVLGSKDDEIKFNLWVFDSGDYDEEHHYANVLEEQVRWYTEKSEALEAAAGKKIYSLAFQHIIVPEVYDALKQVGIKGAYTYSRIYDEDKYYQFDPAVKNYGMLHETPCAGYYNHGQFDAMVQRGDVLAIFTGHDHTNAFGVQYKGIDIVNSLSTRFNGDAFSTMYGYRMIIVDENAPDAYSTRVEHWYDFFKLSDAVALGCTQNENAKLAGELVFLGFFKKLGLKIGIFFTEMFTGRTVKYPD